LKIYGATDFFVKINHKSALFCLKIIYEVAWEVFYKKTHSIDTNQKKQKQLMFL